MYYKKVVLSYLIVAFLLGAIFFGILVYYDPLKLFHDFGKYKNYIHHNMRLQAAGIIRHKEFDSIILGTSMLENTSAEEASDLLDGDFVNLSLEGSSFFERQIVLRYALKKRYIRKVIYSLDDLGTTDKVKYERYALSNWDYLYDSNPFNDFKAYLNDKYIHCLFSLHSKKQCMGREISLDRPNAWYMVPAFAVRYGGLEHWYQARHSGQVRDTLQQIIDAAKGIEDGQVEADRNLKEDLLKSYQYLDETLVDIVKAYPDTEFIFVVPPYSRIKYAIWAQYQKQRFELYKGSLKYLVTQSQKYTNMKIYAWGMEDFLDDIAYYKDLGHYEYKINSWMLKAIQCNEGLLTMQNIDVYLTEITRRALDYGLVPLAKKIEHDLRSMK